MSRIKQAHVTSRFFRDSFLEKYRLTPLVNNNKPAVFFGVYMKLVPRIMEVKAPVICVWAGTDCLHAMRHYHIYEPLFNRTDVQHIVLSMVSRSTLERVARLHDKVLNIKQLPITPLNYDRFTPVAMGKNVYCYAPDKNAEIYSQQLAHMVDNICKANNIAFHLTSNHLVDRSKMVAVYAEAFCNVRLTVHDGLPNTVVEMALMGRRSLWNGDPYFPGIRQWHSITDVLNFVFDESHRETPDLTLREAALDYINVGDQWLHL